MYVEFGSGRGLLTYWLSQCVSDPYSSRFVLVDRASHRHKMDNKLKNLDERIATERIRVDIADFVLRNAPAVKSEPKKPVVGVSKHLCGAATDLALRCLGGSKDVVGGVMIALCCHHRCTRQTYVNNKFLEDECGFDKMDFPLLCGLSSWAVCGTGRPRKEEKPDKAEEDNRSDQQATNNRLGLSLDGREAVGRKVKRIFDVGRAKYVREVLGLSDARLVIYCDKEISPENIVLVAKKKK